MMTRKGMNISQLRRPSHSIQKPTAGLREYVMQKRKCSVISIHEPNPTKMNHEECRNNEIVGHKGIQHPTLAISKCSDSTCDMKRCDTPCDPSSKPLAIGHCTHNDKPPGVFLSDTDLKGQIRTQYGRFYPPENRIEVSEPQATFNADATKELNANQNMLENIKMYEKFYNK